MNQSYGEADSNILGKFRLIAELGRGGMSEVYLSVVAGPAGFNKLTVVKLIKADLAEDPEFISMFLEEARLSARLNHPNVVQTNEVGEHGSRYYISMEYLEGQPYSRIVNRMGRDKGLPLGMSLRILGDVLAGLQYAHDLRDFDGKPLEVVHRDVTPHNIFVTYDGGVKVVDFGIAKAMNSSHETRTGMLKGKVGYMAPEQARGERCDRRADVFSVGVMLWEAAVGRRMWKGLSEVQVLHQLLAGDIPRPRALRSDISEHLEAIILKSLAVDRQNRYPSAAALQADLDELLDAGTERTTLRDVGRRLSAAFDDERQKIRQIIEVQLAKTTNLATGAYNQLQLPVFDPGRMTGEHTSGEGMRPSFGPNGGLPVIHGGSGSNPSVSQRRAGYSGSYPIPSPQVPNVAPYTLPSSYSHPSTGSIARSSVSSASGDPVQASGKRLTFVALALFGAAVLLVGAVYVGFVRSQKPVDDKTTASSAKASQTNSPAESAAVASTATSAASVAAPAVSSAVAAATVSFKVDVKPKDATIYVDDKKIPGAAADVPKDGAKHSIRVEASGYGTRTRDFVASSDETWEIELSPLAGTHPQPPTQQPQDPGHMTVAPTSRPIDTGYPGG